MKVFKFGGASVKDAEGVRNLTQILKRFSNNKLLVVLSAMGKTTNALEEVLKLYFEGKPYLKKLRTIRNFHEGIAKNLFDDPTSVLQELEDRFFEIECYLEREPSRNYDFVYDQLIPLGELVSTKIVSYYLSSQGVQSRWIDARNFIITKEMHREAKLEWAITVPLIQKKLKPLLEDNVILTQGFIGSTRDHVTTTLGREGSDFSASVFAFALDAQDVTVWKDVPGILNADPARFQDTVKFDELNYEDAIEMSYYGARVLHPKTIKPLQNKLIPLYVKSFLNPEDAGTTIHQGAASTTSVSAIILKEKQVLFSISTLDYSFIAEEMLSRIFDAMARFRIKSNVMQNSAISFSFCVDDDPVKTDNLKEALQNEFSIQCRSSLELITIRPYDSNLVNKLLKDRDILLEQRNSHTVQYVVKNR